MGLVKKFEPRPTPTTVDWAAAQRKSAAANAEQARVESDARAAAIRARTPGPDPVFVEMRDRLAAVETAFAALAQRFDVLEARTVEATSMRRGLSWR